MNILLLFLYCFVSTMAVSDKVMTAPIFGLSYGQINALWWKQVKGIDRDENPLLDDNGEHCDVAQAGPLWFLHGTFSPSKSATRQCTIPCDKYLVIPLCNVLADTSPGLDEDGDMVPFYEIETLEEELEQATKAWCLDNQDLQVTVDGVPLCDADLRYARARSYEPFPIFYPSDNLSHYFGVPTPAGIYEGMADGYYVILKPLTPGVHDVSFSAGFYSVIYTLTVESCNP